MRNAFEPILNAIIAALDATAVFVRTKALRALSQILTIDSTVLSSVRRQSTMFSYYSSHLLCSRMFVELSRVTFSIVPLRFEMRLLS